MRVAAMIIGLLIIEAVLLTTTAEDTEPDDLTAITPCDAGVDPVVPYGETEYFVCQKTPVAVGQQESNKGLWIRWGCYPGTPTFDEDSCKPVLEGPLYDPEVQPLMNQLTFCKESETDESVPSGLSCALEYSFRFPDGEDVVRYYQCELENSAVRCGQWHLKTCQEGHIFDGSIQTCREDQTQLEQSRVQMRQAYVPYAPAPSYGYAPQMAAYGYGMPYAAPPPPPAPMYVYPRPVAYAPVQRLTVVPVVPATVGVPMDPMSAFFSSFGMQNMLQYYMSMFPWMYPGYGGYGMPPRGGQRGQGQPPPQQGGGGGPGGGGAPGGGAPGGGAPSGGPSQSGPPGGGPPGGDKPAPAPSPKETAPDEAEPGKDKPDKEKGGGLLGKLGKPKLPGAGGLPGVPGLPKLPGLGGLGMIMPIISKILAPIKKLFG